MIGRVYIVYDERVWGMTDPDRDVLDFYTDVASVLVACDTLDEAKRFVKQDFPGGVVLSYRSQNGNLTDEQYEWSEYNDIEEDRQNGRNH